MGNFLDKQNCNNFSSSSQITTMSSGSSTQILEYRNGIYQGQIKGNKKHGLGILMTDDNIIIAAQWKNDMLSGKGFVFLSPDQYGYGEFNRGEIQGYFLFRGKMKTLFSEFNFSRPINKMVLIDKQTDKIQTIVHKTPIFQVLEERALINQGQNQQQQINRAINVKFPCVTLLQYLQKQFCLPSEEDQKITRKASNLSNTNSHANLNININPEEKPFKVKFLNNGNWLFHFDDPQKPFCLGFTFNKNEQMTSCGMFVNDKLNGLGCKYQNAVRYQGIFDNGFINGIGLKCALNKYSFGHFQEGNLIQALCIDDRSSLSEQKLLEFKKKHHVRSIWYENSYIRRNLMKFRGINDLIFQVSEQQQYMYPLINTLFNNFAQKKQHSLNHSFANSPQVNKKSSVNISTNSKYLALNVLGRREQKIQTKSSPSQQEAVKTSQKGSLRGSLNGTFHSHANANMNIQQNNRYTETKRVQQQINIIKPLTQSFNKNPQDEETLAAEERSSPGDRERDTLNNSNNSNNYHFNTNNSVGSIYNTNGVKNSGLKNLRKFKY